VRALLIANDDDADPGVIGRLATEAGYRFEVLSREEPAAWPGLEGADFVLSLGSEWSVYWDHVGESVAAEAALLAAAHRAAVPVLGICFGAQMVAHALGGTVRRAPFAEIGWYEIDSSFPDDIAPGPWFEWHVDTFTVPAGATELARSAVGPQAFRIGRTAAVQFHPEITEAILRRWMAGGKSALDAAGLDVDELIGATRAQIDANAQRSRGLFDSFCSDVVGR
jgi:GMP synthase-like glutamine amidotransferase